MSAPAPPTALANQVSAIHANTLYAYQPDAFQSISLTTGSQWNSLPMGVSVNGSQAVLAQSGGQDALFIVGGRSNASESSFPGFQKFTFDNNSWQSLSPETSVAQNRVQHGAAWLETSKSILIFGGSQDNSYSATAQSYTISTEEPYVMKSFPGGAPAVQNPILMPYNTSHALLAGGGANQQQIWTFSEDSGWIMMTTTIPGGIADASKVQGAVVDDGKGGKQLELFDMSQSPNKVTTVSLSDKYQKRHDQEIAERDGSSAPTATRSGFSLAQASDLIVLSGGTSDQQAGPVAIFNQGKSAWEDPSSVFGSQQVPVNGHSTSNGPSDGSSSGQSSAAGAASSGAPASSGATASNGAAASSAAPASSGALQSSGASSGASATATATATATASSAASTGASSGTATGTVTGASATSGSASATNSAGTTATGTGAGAASTAAGAGAGAASASSTAAATPSADSTTIILAAVLGSFFGIAALFLIALLLVRYRRNKSKQQQLRQEAFDEKRAGSPASSLGVPNHAIRNRSPFENGQTPQISRPTLEPQTQAEDLAPPRTLGQDDEWGRYFNNNNTVENLYPGQEPQSHHIGAAVGGAAVGAAAGVGLAAANNARNTTYTVGSEYTIDSPNPSTNRHESDVVPPLNVRHSSYGQMGHARSVSDTSSNNRSTFFNSGSGAETWDPTSSSSDTNSHVRPASSVYYDRASSVYPPTLSPNTMSNFPPVPARPLAYGEGPGDKGMRSIISTDFGNGEPINMNGMSFPESAARRISPGTLPRSAGNATGHNPNGSERDLSWLQIGSAN